MVQSEKEGHLSIQKLMESPDFQDIGNEISRKLNTMIDENYHLKNKVSQLESKV